MVHASHPYKAVGNTTVSRTLSFVFLHCPFQIEIIFVNRVVAIASLLLISGVLFPFASILAPRYSKLLTLSISSPSIAQQPQNNIDRDSNVNSHQSLVGERCFDCQETIYRYCQQHEDGHVSNDQDERN